MNTYQTQVILGAARMTLCEQLATTTKADPKVKELVKLMVEVRNQKSQIKNLKSCS
jgi:hypothetical protein